MPSPLHSGIQTPSSYPQYQGFPQEESSSVTTLPGRTFSWFICVPLFLCICCDFISPFLMFSTTVKPNSSANSLCWYCFMLYYKCISCAIIAFTKFLLLSHDLELNEHFFSSLFMGCLFPFLAFIYHLPCGKDALCFVFKLAVVVNVKTSFYSLLLTDKKFCLMGWYFFIPTLELFGNQCFITGVD